ncbi:MAG TPA: NAD-binding protein [Acidimicrobiales bacterium]|nr:NAD-binding protein [Acidimicrobiales bacterium]
MADAEAQARTKQERAVRRISRRSMQLAGLALFVLVMAPLGFWLFEQNENVDVETVPQAYLWLVRTLIEQGSAYDIETAGGYIIYYLVEIAGISLVAFVSGAIASKLVTTVMNRGKGMGSTNAKDHVVICGWSGKGAEIIRELRAREFRQPPRIVVLANLQNDPTKIDEVEFIRGDPSDETDLLRAGIDRCAIAIVLADESTPAATDAERDARTLFTVLAVETVNADAYSCVEVIRSDNRRHFANTRANELVISGEVTGALLAGSAANPGLSRVVTNLVTHPDDQEFYRIPVPPDLVGQPVSAALVALKEQQDALLVAIVQGMDDYHLNPPMDRVLLAGDKLLVISNLVRLDATII